MKVNTSILIIAVLSLLGLVYYLGGVNARQDRDMLSEVLIQSQDSLLSADKQYTLVIHNQKRYISEQNQIVLSERAAKEAALIDKEKYRKLHLKDLSEITRLEGRIEILEDSLENNIQIIYVKDSVPCAKLPFDFWKVDKHVNLKGNVSTTGAVGVNFKIPLELDLSIGIKKRVPTAIVTTDNPYVTIDKINSIKIEKNEYFWNKTWFKVGVGAVGGALFVGVIK